jgi:hypothetical protein
MAAGQFFGGNQPNFPNPFGGFSNPMQNASIQGANSQFPSMAFNNNPFGTGFNGNFNPNNPLVKAYEV